MCGWGEQGTQFSFQGQGCHRLWGLGTVATESCKNGATTLFRIWMSLDRPVWVCCLVVRSLNCPQTTKWNWHQTVLKLFRLSQTKFAPAVTGRAFRFGWNKKVSKLFWICFVSVSFRCADSFSVRVVIRFIIWYVTGYVQVFILLSVVIVPYPFRVGGLGPFVGGVVPPPRPQIGLRA